MKRNDSHTYHYTVIKTRKFILEILNLDLKFNPVKVTNGLLTKLPPR